MDVDNNDNDKVENSESVEMKDADNHTTNGSTESNGDWTLNYFVTFFLSPESQSCVILIHF